MKNQRSTQFLPLIFIITLSYFSCKKADSSSASIIGTWELKEIALLESNKTYPLDSFRNVNAGNFVFNADSTFTIKDNFGEVQILPLSDRSLSLSELYNKPRNSKARFIIVGGYKNLPVNSSKFSVKGNLINFETKYADATIVREERFSHQFELKSNNELEIHRENLLLYNQQNNTYLTYKMKFIYKKNNL